MSLLEETDCDGWVRQSWRVHFFNFGFAVAHIETVNDLLNVRYGWGVDPSILQTLGKQTIELELEFIRNAGFTKAHARLPEWMTREPVPLHNVVFDL